MKVLTCKQMGGMCDEKISGNTKDEMIANGMKHVQQAHPDMAASIQKMSKDDPMMVDWQKNFDQAYEAAPEM